MGIYVFKREVLQECLDNDFADFGKNIIPAAIRKYKVTAYIFQGYWEDIGTIDAFFEANLNLTDPNPKFNFNEPGAPIYTHPRFLPASIVRQAHIDRSLVCDGCIIEKASIEHSIIGIRSVIDPDTVIKDVILMGADYYEAEGRARGEGAPHIGIGRGCNIRNAIIDKNARIGDNVTYLPGRQGQGNERRRILHSRRNRGHPEKQHNPVRDSDIAARNDDQDKSDCLAVRLYASRRLLFRSPAHGRTVEGYQYWLLGVWEHKDAKGRIYRARVVPLTGDRYFVSFQTPGERRIETKRVWEFEGWISRIGLQPLSFSEVQVSSGEVPEGGFRIRQLSSDRPEHRCHPPTCNWTHRRKRQAHDLRARCAAD